MRRIKKRNAYLVKQRKMVLSEVLAVETPPIVCKSFVDLIPERQDEFGPHLGSDET